MDTGEDLSYGPGIVSKLRCRYLSLTLRESRQQNNKQRLLQRSTSLNTLLDREDDDPDGADEAPPAPPTAAAAAAAGATGSVAETSTAGGTGNHERAKVAVPPILGVKPVQAKAALPQRPVSLGAANGNAPGAVLEEANLKPSSGNRSRHFKRGNEVMKRARSVEALLCDKSPWNNQRISSVAIKSPAASPTCVTIEDKINNARERLHSGTDTAPPKRLTSIIDDTERPPPDLVKQTLKMFEASANRRPRTAHRSNGVGGVASKVASYKSIIKGTPPPPAASSLGFASSTPLRATAQPPDIIPRQASQVGASAAADSSMSQLSMVMRRIDLQAPPDEQQQQQQQSLCEAPSETELCEGGGGAEDGDEADEGAGAGEGNGEGDDDNNEKHDNDNTNDEGSDNNEQQQRDKMGAGAGDKLKLPAMATTTTTTTTATAEAGGAQRSFAPITENAHVVRKLNSDTTVSASTTTKQIGVIRPLFNSQGATPPPPPPLTSREIEKNRINEMKKSGASSDGAGPGAGSSSPTTSLDTVINTKPEPSVSETDASPIWMVRKLRSQSQGAAGGAGVASSSSHSHSTENTSMVFNFSKSTKEVPDYIESDVVIYRRKRELPKPNEPGFVLLGDLSVETSTDTDYDDYSMCPPSPCDVEFENANIVIDGKSSIRQKPKDSTFRVQFNDTLTSTFEYPSEASMTIDDPPYADPFGHGSKHHPMLLAEQMQLLQHQQQLQMEQQQQQQHQHHHVTVDEIIELPTSTAAGHGHGHGHSNNKTVAGATGGGTMLGNIPLDFI
ncbi:hypothetical protein KR018_007083 [Drosophila ironensis]|nr:hypothetical protein KR018_007083 [Drosophila ironensis]